MCKDTYMLNMYIFLCLTYLICSTRVFFLYVEHVVNRSGHFTCVEGGGGRPTREYFTQSCVQRELTDLLEVERRWTPTDQKQ